MVLAMPRDYVLPEIKPSYDHNKILELLKPILTEPWFLEKLKKAEFKVHCPVYQQTVIFYALYYLSKIVYNFPSLKQYIVIDSSIFAGQKAVQAVHAYAELANKSQDKPDYQLWFNDYKTVIVLSIENLEENISKFGEESTDYELFREINMNNKVTAIALYDKKGLNPILKTLRLVN